MKYTVIGVGGTGGILGFQLTKGGKDCTLIARGGNLSVMEREGLSVHHLWDDTTETIPVKAASSDHYMEIPDVILVCVKYYSIDSILPMVRKMAGKDTVILPILNVFGTGEKMQEALPDLHVLDGCIYVSAEKQGLGKILQHGPILRVVFGERDGSVNDKLRRIEQDFQDSGITPVLTEHVQREGEERDTFIAMIREISELASAMGYAFDKDYVSINLEILSHLDPSATTSMQRDVAAGHASEMEGLVFDVVRRAETYGVEMPVYRKIAESLQ